MFSKLKSLFKKTIVAPAKTEQYSVCLSSAKHFIKLFTPIEVKPNFNAVVTSNNKVLDVLPEGNYELTTANLPYATKKFKLIKPRKSGSAPNGFYAEIYYVSKNEFHNVEFYNCRKIKVKDKNFIDSKIGFKGRFDYQIINPAEFLGALFYEFGKIKTNMAEEQLALWISELVCKRIEKSKLGLEKLYARDSECFANLVEYLNDEIFDIGIKILSVDIYEIILPKKVYKKTVLDYTETVLTNQQPNKVEEFIQEQVSQSTLTTVAQTEIVQPTVSQSLPQQFVVRKIGIKVCPNCGAKCAQNAEICYMCSQKLN